MPTSKGKDELERTMARSHDRTIHQAGAIPYRFTKGTMEIALITNRSGRRWIAPKGTIGPEETAAMAAVREAQEEAGVVGVLGEPIGTLIRAKRGVRYETVMHPLAVLRTFHVWPECSVRERNWVSASDAAALVHRDLGELIDRSLRSLGPDHDHVATA